MLQRLATVTVMAGYDDGLSRAGAAVRAADTGGFLRRTPRVGPRRRCQPGFRVPGQAERGRVAMRLVMQLERDTDGRLCGEITREGAVTWLGFSGTLEMLKVLEELVSAGDGRGTER
jgi:hypothetical protein